MKIIGITGKSGAGKSTLALLLSKKLNCKHIDIDTIGHEALFQPQILDSLCNKLGREILDEDGSLNRKKVGSIVFSSKDKMNILTDLTWEYMKNVLNDLLSQADNFIILDWALLPITEYWEKCDTKILVTSDFTQRKNQILERDHISEEYFNIRDSSSIDYSQVKFDYIFENDYQLETLNKFLEILN